MSAVDRHGLRAAGTRDEDEAEELARAQYEDARVIDIEEIDAGEVAAQTYW